MKLLSLKFCICLFGSFALTVTACSDTKESVADNTTDDPDEQAGPKDAGASTADLGPAYLLMHTVSSPEGRENYVYVVPDLEVGDLDPKGGREVSGASRSFVLNGKVYVADGETFIINRFDVDGKLNMVPSGEMSLVNHGLTYFDTGWTFVSDDVAYYMNSEEFEVIVWDPEKMEITGTIDLTSLQDDSYPNFYADGGTKIGDLLYFTFWNYDENGGPYDRAVAVAVINTKTNELVNVTRDDRCEMGWPGTALPNGDFYIVGNAAGIGYQFSEPPAKPNCLLRILAGETEFDTEFVQYTDDITTPLVGGSTFDYAKELQAGVVWSTETGTFADKDAFFTDSVWHPVLVNPTDWTAQVIDSISAQGWKGDTFIIDGKAHFTVGTNGGSKVLSSNSALVQYEDGVLKEMIGFSDWLQVAQRIR